MPLPLAMMIPFMGIQSAVMAKQFGENFQYGKRRISAMSNEEFNKLTPAMLQERTNAELKAMIPNMQQSIIDMQGFQEFLVKQFVKMIGDILIAGLGKIIGVSDADVEKALQDIDHFLHGHPFGHEGTTTTVVEETPTTTVITDTGERPSTATREGEPEHYYNDKNPIHVDFQYALFGKMVRKFETQVLSNHKAQIGALRKMNNDAYNQYIFNYSRHVHTVTGGIWI